MNRECISVKELRTNTNGRKKTREYGEREIERGRGKSHGIRTRKNDAQGGTKTPGTRGPQTLVARGRGVLPLRQHTAVYLLGGGGGGCIMNVTEQEESWNESGGRGVRLSSLKGKYDLRMRREMNTRDGDYIENVATIRMRIAVK